MASGRVTVKMPHKGRTGVVDIECGTKMVKVPVGPYRFVGGSRKGQFVPIRNVQRNFAALVKELAKRK